MVKFSCKYAYGLLGCSLPYKDTCTQFTNTNYLYEEYDCEQYKGVIINE